MTDELSRLLSGELSEAEAADLRARIAGDPDLAARWERMRALPGRLGALPKTLPLPRTLLPAEPRSVAPAPVHAIAHMRALRWAAAVGWAAAAVLIALQLRPAPVRILAQGEEWVDGRAELLAGDVRVTVDGKATVRVEPPGTPQREIGAEAPMHPSHALSALAGSLVTVAVLEGHAWLYAPDAPPREVHAGETRSVREPVAPVAPPSTPAPPGDEVAQLRQTVARLETEKAVATARLRRHEGTPMAWPKDAPASFQPDAFEALFSARVATIPDAELAYVDCDEFPCIAIVESRSASPQWEEPLKGLAKGLDGAGFGEDVSVLALANEMGTPDGDHKLYAVAVAPADLAEDAGARIQYRASAAMKDVAGVP